MAAPTNDSRYAESLVDYFAPSKKYDNVPVMFYEFSDLGKLKYIEYSWKIGDRIDTLAAKYFLFPNRWWIIAEFNPQIDDWLNITPGTVVRIPRV